MQMYDGVNLSTDLEVLMRRVFPSIVAILVLAGTLPAQTNEKILSIAFRGTYTTSSKVFNNPDSPSSDMRGEYVALDNIYGPGIEVRVNIPGQFVALTIAAEYLSKENVADQLVGFTTPPRRLSVREGFRLIPIELGANVPIPLGSDGMRLSIGGGVGAYIGTRVLNVAGAEAPQQNKPVSYGIHVETNFDYQIIPRLYARVEMRFRDPEFTTESKFEQQATQANGVLILLPHEPFRARINVNGLTFGLGFVFEVF
jgi:hypothetical protein